MNKVAESIQRLKKEVIALNKELLELEEAYTREQKVHDILCKDYNNLFDDYMALYKNCDLIISVSSEDQDRILDEYAECRKTLGI